MENKRWTQFAWLGGLLGGLIALVTAFRLRRRVLALVLHLPQPLNAVRVERPVYIPMRDGVNLATDIYAPAYQQAYPVILIRSPYGRNRFSGAFGFLTEMVAQRFAERGYRVVVQDVRGRFDSEGEFEPYFHERNDGLDTLEWLKRQAWFDGRLGMWGPSYLGIVQWAIADAPEMQAMFPMITSSQLHNILFPDGAFDLGLMLRWMTLLELGEKPRYQSPFTGSLMLLEMVWRVTRAAKTLPVINADVLLTDGKPISYYRRWLDHASPDDPIWDELLKSVNHEDVSSPVHLVGGWYDFFLRGLVNDYWALKAAGKNPVLTIGNWYHFSHIFLMSNLIDKALAWFDRQFYPNRQHPDDHPVNLFVMGLEEWRGYPEFPPPSQSQRLYLAGQHTLTRNHDDSAPDQYRYDPATPTPAFRGAQFGLIAGTGDNRHFAQRRDVVVYTSPILQSPLEIVGQVNLELYVRSSLEHTDFYGRLCDVYPDGKVINICDGLRRVHLTQPANEDGVCCVCVDLWMTAYHFKAGHRLQLIVGSGAHPRWNRHTGGENPLTDVQLRPADQTIYHDSQHPSALILPVVLGTLDSTLESTPV